MQKIQILPPALINQIAAGEVVERPASVIKELVENAIDAGATRIEILASEGGRHLRVADNGCGMGKEDLEIAFKNHATSKVHSQEDLFALHTLGFRGEALASIAAISKTTCTSRPGDRETGLKAVVDASGEVVLQEAGCAPGTIFEVHDLFYNVPARLKFLKRPQTELSYIQEMVQMLAMSHPEIAFRLQLETSQSLKTSGLKDLATTLREVFSLSATETMLPFSLEDPEAGYRVWGQTSTPDVTRGTKKWIQIFVNGRGVRCAILGKAIETAYDSLMVPGKYPVTVLFLQIPPAEVDVNVHPTKKEVKYEKANTLFSFVRKALDTALAQFNPMMSARSIPSKSAGRSHFSGAPAMANNASRHPYTSGPTRMAAFSAQAPLESQVVSPAQSHSAQSMMTTYTADTATITALAEPSDLVALPSLPPFRVIGQLAKTYILLEMADGLMIVDQHIACERVLFERFFEQAERQAPVSQPLIIPMHFPIAPVQQAMLTENQAAFEQLGFVYRLVDAGVEFTMVPALYNQKVLKSSLEALLQDLEQVTALRLDFDLVIATAACHSAVRAGDYLSQEQMQRVVTDWFSCCRPWTCPHGRPVSRLVSHREIMAFFERPSLPETRDNLMSIEETNVS